MQIKYSIRYINIRNMYGKNVNKPCSNVRKLIANLLILSQQDFRFSVFIVSSKSERSLAGVGNIILLLRPRYADACFAELYIRHDWSIFNGTLSTNSSVLKPEPFLIGAVVVVFPISVAPEPLAIARRRLLLRFESKPFLALNKHDESVLKSSTECNSVELLVALIGFMNRVSPIVSLSSSSWSPASPPRFTTSKRTIHYYYYYDYTWKWNSDAKRQHTDEIAIIAIRIRTQFVGIVVIVEAVFRFLHEQMLNVLFLVTFNCPQVRRRRMQFAFGWFWFDCAVYFDGSIQRCRNAHMQHATAQYQNRSMETEILDQILDQHGENKATGSRSRHTNTISQCTSFVEVKWHNDDAWRCR